MDTTKDWQFGKTLPDRINYMLQNQLMCDVTFHVGANRTPIKAHKFMLASASPVFYSMFDGPMAEKGDVSIPDIEANIFKDILNYIYTDIITVDATNIRGLMYGSEKYMLHVIKDKCSHYLQSSLDEEHACVILQTAHDFHLDDLKTNTLEFILNSGEPCLESKSFLSLSPECLRLVIESDYLKCEEEIIHKKIIKWSTNRCQHQNLPVNDKNIRQVLGDLLYLVRFPIMERKYFTENVSKKSLLSYEEIINVYQSLDDEKIAVFFYQSLDDEKIAVFSTKRRNTELIVCLRCDTANLGHWTQAGPNDNLDFTTNIDCIMLGINVFGSKNYSGKHDISLTVLKSSKVLGSRKTVLYSEKGQEMYPVMLDKPLHVKNNIRYTIQLNMMGPTTFTGESYKEIVGLNELSVTFVSSSSSTNSTSETRGQIPGIIVQHKYKK